MTCIVGLVHQGRVWMGGDSAGVGEGYKLVVRADRKVFRNGPFLMGFTYSFRMGQLLAHAFKPPPRHPDDDVFGWMATAFVDAVRECFRAGGFAAATEDAERGGFFLVGYAGRLFQLQADYQVQESVHGFDACGCGEPYALASLWETQGGDPERRLRRALTAAQMFSAGVREPFHIERLDA